MNLVIRSSFLFVFTLVAFLNFFPNLPPNMLCYVYKIKQTKQQNIVYWCIKRIYHRIVYPKCDPSKVLLCACGGIIVTSFFSVHVPVRKDDNSRYIRCFIPVYNVPSKNHVYIVILWMSSITNIICTNLNNTSIDILHIKSWNSFYFYFNIFQLKESIYSEIKMQFLEFHSCHWISDSM